MADLIAFALYDSAGAPLTGVVPSFLAYLDRSAAARAQPAIAELGGGLYGFAPADTDAAAGTVFLVDGGAIAEPRYHSGLVTTDDAPFAAFHLVDDAGALFAEAGSPELASYKDAEGNSRDAPTIEALAGAYLFCFSPTAEDLALDIAWELEGPDGASPERLFGFFNGLQSTLGPAVNPAADLATKIASLGPYTGITLTVDTNLFTGPLRPVRTEVPPLSVFCLNARGQRPEPYLNDRADFTKFQVEVTVRGPPPFGTTEQLARDVMAAIQRQPPSGYTTCLLEQAGPEYRGEDGSADGERLSLFVFFVELWRKV